MPFPNNNTESLIKLLFDTGSAPPLYMSLHTDQPGEDLANEVSYPGYERQRFAGDRYTSFPQLTASNIRIVVTHAAISTSMIGGTAIVIAEVSPGIVVSFGVTPMVLLMYDVPSLLSQMPPPPPPPPEPRATMGSRFAALAAELEDDEG